MGLLDNWNFSGFPAFLHKHDYKKTIDFLKAKEQDCRFYIVDKNRHKALHPGITDIDLVIVCDDPTDVNLDYDQLPIKIREVLYHDPLILNEALFKDFIDMCGLRQSVLKDMDGSACYHINSDKKICLIRDLDDLYVHIAPYMYRSYLTKSINVRKMLHKLLGLSVFLHYLEKNFDTKLRKKRSCIRKKVLQLRKDWFSLPIIKRRKQLVSLVETSVPLLRDYFGVFDTLLGNKQGTCILEDQYFPTVFSDGGFAVSEKLFQLTGMIITNVPHSLSSLLWFHADQQGRIADHVRSHLRGDAVMLPDMFHASAYLHHRFNEDHLQFCMQHDIGHGPLLHFHLHEKRGVKGRFRQAVNRVRLHRAFQSL